jgi:hypothetical protein
MTQFAIDNDWMINRGDGSPSVNLVVLAFVDPLKLLHKTTDTFTENGVQRGMTQAVVDYFKIQDIRVMLSIGGITYVDFWNQALAENATQLGLNAAELATNLSVGIEIDYEENTNPNLEGLQDFINAYRLIHPYNATGTVHESRLTIDVAPGDRYLIDINRKATADWLTSSTSDPPLLDYANAMVAARPYKSGNEATGWWQEHVDGKSNFAPPVLPLPPAKFTGALYLTSRSGLDECVNYASSITSQVKEFVETVQPNGAGTTNGMLGVMFWAAGCPSTRKLCTFPSDDNTCEGGVGVASNETNFGVPVPMEELRQD